MGQESTSMWENALGIPEDVTAVSTDVLSEALVIWDPLSSETTMMTITTADLLEILDLWNPPLIPPGVGAPAPASAYCTQLGYDSEVDGCIFPDGTTCGTWDFYRGKCGQEFTFCGQHGYTIESIIDDMGSWTAEYAVCIFDDGSECLEQDYYEGLCYRSECSEWKMSEGGCVE